MHHYSHDNKHRITAVKLAPPGYLPCVNPLHKVLYCNIFCSLGWVSISESLLYIYHIAKTCRHHYSPVAHQRLHSNCNAGVGTWATIPHWIASKHDKGLFSNLADPSSATWCWKSIKSELSQSGIRTIKYSRQPCCRISISIKFAPCPAEPHQCIQESLSKVTEVEAIHFGVIEQAWWILKLTGNMYRQTWWHTKGMQGSTSQ